MFVDSILKHKYWGTSLCSLEHSFAQIIISFIHLARRVYRLLASLVDMPLCHIILLQSLDPQSSLFSYIHLSLDMCISFHSYFEIYTLYGGTHTILVF